MLTKYEDVRRLDPETGVNQPFENVSCQGRIQKIFRRGASNLSHFTSVVFSAELILTNLSYKNDFREVRRYAPPKKFCKFTYCNGHFSAFWTIFRQILSIFLAPNFECFTKYDVFCSHSFEYACLRQATQAYCYKEVRSYGKVLCI